MILIMVVWFSACHNQTTHFSERLQNHVKLCVASYFWIDDKSCIPTFLLMNHMNAASVSTIPDQIVNVIHSEFRNGYFCGIYTLENPSTYTIIMLVIICFMVWMSHQDIPRSNELYIVVVTMTTVAMVTMKTMKLWFVFALKLHIWPWRHRLQQATWKVFTDIFIYWWPKSCNMRFF